MSDLISRSALIDVIWDVFNQYCNDSDRFDEYETEAINMAFKVLQGVIEKEPTAYDVEKVVGELENEKMRYYLSIANTGERTYDFAYEKVGNALDYAINIVEGGTTK